VVFTKCEALEVKAINALQQQGVSFDDAMARAPEDAKHLLEKIHQKLKDQKFPPKGHVALQGKQCLYNDLVQKIEPNFRIEPTW
jgi:hypothetical protein